MEKLMIKSINRLTRTKSTKVIQVIVNIVEVGNKNVIIDN